MAVTEVEDMHVKYVDPEYLRQRFEEAKCPECEKGLAR